ncbi:ATP-binding protein [Sedimentisphaera salicampi]|uniref:DNA polymerase III subunit delta' n=1 Tax=Sedimentisphaera salicampi TaxID=1941349 RepID=A0A1W6LNE9_9BACT|nr:DNA polymerase III subunit delta' C-terminal domain-containing protein [Sedimentisphaera salicampi]ARN57271.1 DNA polymerase III subunit delta' [Sedimentisphaera salicampi]OXU14588.1 DNA polymerase III subunit delta' [Sedimentisphaera salicampi]
MSLKDIHSQNHIITAFEDCLNAGRLGQSFIFAGQDGVGRFKCASEIAKLLLCENPAKTEQNGKAFQDSCGQCRSCKLFESGSHPDFKHIYKELNKYSEIPEIRKKSPSEFLISVVREFFVDKAGKKPQLAGKTVFVLSEAEKLNQSAQNAILKTLEEPPPHCIIILICTRTDRLLETILSRCQVYNFAPVEKNIIARELSRRGVEQNEAFFWAGFTSGSLGKSLELSSLEANCYSIKTELLEKLESFSLADAVELAEWLGGCSGEIAGAVGKISGSEGKAGLKRHAQTITLNMVMSAAIDAMKNAAGSEELINHDQPEVIASLSEKIDPYKASKLVEDINSSISMVYSYVNEKLIFEDILINFARTKE